MPQYESTKRAIANYHKYKLKRVPLDLNKRDFEDRIKPAIDRSGLPVQTFIKAAIEEKIAREGLDEGLPKVMLKKGDQAKAAPPENVTKPETKVEETEE